MDTSGGGALDWLHAVPGEDRASSANRVVSRFISNLLDKKAVRAAYDNN
jgi:hypothetical protein